MFVQIITQTVRGVGKGGQGGQSPPHFLRREGIAPHFFVSNPYKLLYICKSHLLQCAACVYTEYRKNVIF